MNKTRNSAPDPLDLAPLEDAYEIVGELRGRDDARELMGKRRADGVDVRITVFRAADATEMDGLTLLAADTRLLDTRTHRNLFTVLDSRWMGTDAFAVISPRSNAPTVWELVARGERFSTPRVAEILHELNGLLTWAREQQIVHRKVSARTIVLESGSGRVCASFEIGAVPKGGTAGAERDAVTIAALAWTMLTGSERKGADAEQLLAVLRPDLPKRVVEHTQAMLQSGAPNSSSVDVLGYIAMIAMADTLLVGEVDTARVNAELAETRAELERYVAAERAELERFAVAERDQLAADRRELERLGVAAREQLEADRRELERSLASERAALERSVAAERQQLALDRSNLEEQRAEAERNWAESQRAMLEFDGLRSAGESTLTPVRELTPLDREVALSPGVAPGPADAREAALAIPSAGKPATRIATAGSVAAPGSLVAANRSRRASMMLLAVACLLAVILVPGIIHTRKQSEGSTPNRLVAKGSNRVPAPSDVATDGATVFDSAGGNVSALGPPPFAETGAATLIPTEPAAGSPARASNPPLDSLARDSVVKRDSVIKLKPDTSVIR